VPAAIEATARPVVELTYASFFVEPEAVAARGDRVMAVAS
jgi:hypothetical protein